MSDVSVNTMTAGQGHDAHGDGHGTHHDHPKHLAHHFDTPEQQFASAKFGMWIFLATELLMFGGLFCAYAVYRHNHPDVFLYAHHFLDKIMGGINTVVLIASSLTMAWAVRASQLGQQKLLLALLGVTLLGGYGFMTIKAMEYHHKYEVNLWVGPYNIYNKDFKDPVAAAGNLAIPNLKTTAATDASPLTPAVAGAGEALQLGTPSNSNPGADTQDLNSTGISQATANHTDDTKAALARIGPEWIDPNAGSGDEAQIKPAFVQPLGLAPKVIAARQPMELTDMPKIEQGMVNTFFGIYFTMTGLHGVHVVVGMGLIFWVMVRAATPGQRKWVWPAGLASIGVYLVFCGLLTAGYLTGGGYGDAHAADYTAQTTQVASSTNLNASSTDLRASGDVHLSATSAHHAGAGQAASMSGLALLTFGAGGVVTVAGVVWMLIGFIQGRSLTGPGEFGPEYFTPVDLVGLYWHLVDLIWIFLFPLLYLIH